MRDALQQQRPAAGARGVDVAADRAPQRGHVGAVDDLALEPVRGHDVAHALHLRVCAARRELGDAVVLADEDQRQVPERGEIDGLVEVPGLDRPVAEEGDRNLVRAAQLGGERIARGQRQIAADDAGRAHQAVGAIDEVHRSAEPLAEPGTTAHQLGHHRLHRSSLGERVPVRPVSAVDAVVGP